ncbi:MAG: cytochrome c family protein [Sphingomonadales bacterium]|nr:cytochrome c family protein [Sphingomonadales bacterium]
MDSFEWNKVAASILCGLLLIWGLRIFSDALFHVEPLAANAYVVEGVVVADATGDAGGPAVPEGPSLAVLLAEASVDSGAKVFRKCQACHTMEQGGANRVGPNLYDVVGRALGATAGFSYSDALLGHGGDWSYEALNAYLENPRKAIPGNKMSFAGLRKATDRADVIAYLRSYGDNPPPLPEAPADQPSVLQDGPPTDAETAPAETAEEAPAETPEETPTE